MNTMLLVLRMPIYTVVAVTLSGILKAKQKLGITFNSDKLGGMDFTKFSKLTLSHLICTLISENEGLEK